MQDCGKIAEINTNKDVLSLTSYLKYSYQAKVPKIWNKVVNSEANFGRENRVVNIYDWLRNEVIKKKNIIII